jgi:hypothetical protein
MSSVHPAPPDFEVTDEIIAQRKTAGAETLDKLKGAAEAMRAKFVPLYNEVFEKERARVKKVLAEFAANGEDAVVNPDRKISHASHTYDIFIGFDYNGTGSIGFGFSSTNMQWSIPVGLKTSVCVTKNIEKGHYEPCCRGSKNMPTMFRADHFDVRDILFRVIHSEFAEWLKPLCLANRETSCAKVTTKFQDAELPTEQLPYPHYDYVYMADSSLHRLTNVKVHFEYKKKRSKQDAIITKRRFNNASRTMSSRDRRAFYSLLDRADDDDGKRD